MESQGEAWSLYLNILFENFVFWEKSAITFSLEALNYLSNISRTNSMVQMSKEISKMAMPF